jgi:hypothetical protein
MRERARWLFFLGCHFAFYLFLFGCLQWYSNSNLSILRECSPCNWPLFTWTSLPPGYHKNHLIWVDLCLIVFFEIVLRLSTFDKKDQSHPPDCLENLLIWVDSIKMIPLGLVVCDPWKGSPINPSYPFFKRISQIDGSTLCMYILSVIPCIVPDMSICINS